MTSKVASKPANPRPNNRLAFVSVLLVLLLSACQVSDAQVATAIAQTEAARPSATPLPPTEPTTPAPSPITAELPAPATPTASSTSRPTYTPPPTALPFGFEAPVNCTVIDYEGDYIFTIRPASNAQGYRWVFLQNGAVVWDDDTPMANGSFKIIGRDMDAHRLFAPGPVQVQVQPHYRNGAWGDPIAMIIYLKPRSDPNTPVFDCPAQVAPANIPTPLPTSDVPAGQITPTRPAVPTSTPAIPSTPGCGGTFSRLSIGDTGRVVPGGVPNRVRSDPWVSDTNQIGVLQPGTVIQVLGGPVCADGLVFWKVGHESIPGGAGWTAEGNGDAYYLEPYKP